MKTVSSQTHTARGKGWRSWCEEAQVLTKIGTAYAAQFHTASDTTTTLPVTRTISREATPCRTVRIYFIKPSKYDEDGYVLRFWKGVLPNNTLTALAALNEEYNRLRATKNIFVETILWDEIVDGAINPETIQAIKDKGTEDGVEVLIGMAGVQTNQYPRGRDTALQFVAAGFTVMMGGFHVSGYPDSCKFLNSCGITTVAGEAENTWVQILDDYLNGELQPHYSVTTGIRAKPALARSPSQKLLMYNYRLLMIAISRALPIPR